MGKTSERINGFEQIKSFYSWVFNNQDKNVKPQHISLYNFLINQNNRNNWVEWFKCPFDLAMAGSCIGNKKTYYDCLDDLVKWKLIQYQKGINNWKAPLIKIEVLNRTATDTATVPQSEPQPIPLHIPLPTPLPTHIYKLLTYNLKRITDNLEEIIFFLDEKNDGDLKDLPETKPKIDPEKKDFLQKIIESFALVYAEKFGIEYTIITKGKETAAVGKLLCEYKKKYPDANSEQTLEGLTEYFRKCVKIKDKWLSEHMSLPTIVSKFNEINNILSGKNQSGNKVSDEYKERLYQNLQNVNFNVGS